MQEWLIVINYLREGVKKIWNYCTILLLHQKIKISQQPNIGLTSEHSVNSSCLLWSSGNHLSVLIELWRPYKVRKHFFPNSEIEGMEFESSHMTRNRSENGKNNLLLMWFFQQKDKIGPMKTLPTHIDGFFSLFFFVKFSPR